MRELARFLFDVVVALVVAVGGIILQSSLGLGLWSVPLAFLPLWLWCWWRGAVPRSSLPWILVATGTLCLYGAVKAILWPNPPDWAQIVELSCIFVLLERVHSLFRRRQRMSQSSN